MDANVEYRDIPGFPGYRVGDDGSVWSCRSKKSRGVVWDRRKLEVKREGYICVTLWIKGRAFKRYVHRLVLEAFVAPCQPGVDGCHCDGDRTNNRLSNLRWDTPKNNEADKVKHGTQTCGERSGAAKLTEAAVIEARELYATDGWTLERLAEKNGVRISTIHEAIRGDTWKYLQSKARGKSRAG